MQQKRESVTETDTQSRSLAVGLARGADRLIVGIARHWVALFVAVWGLYVLLPVVAPGLMAVGEHAPAYFIYRLYAFFCHQLPDHSYFLFGPDPVPMVAALEAGGMPSGLTLFQQRRFVGSPEVGYKVAICQRDMAIYGSFVVAGLIFGLLRNRVRIRSLSIKMYLVLLIPIAVDGLTQMVGLRTSDWFLRTITGVIFGVATVWLIYPYIETAMRDVVETETQRQRAAGTS